MSFWCVTSLFQRNPNERLNGIIDLAQQVRVGARAFLDGHQRWVAFGLFDEMQPGCERLASETQMIPRTSRLSIPVGSLDTGRSPSNLPPHVECQSYMWKALFLVLQLWCQVWRLTTAQAHTVPADPSRIWWTTSREGRASYQAGQ